MRRNQDQLKQKVDGDEIDSLNTLINELYERMMEMAKSGGSKDGSGVAAGNPSLLSFPTRNVTVKENQKMKELSE